MILWHHIFKPILFRWYRKHSQQQYAPTFVGVWDTYNARLPDSWQSVALIWFEYIHTGWLLYRKASRTSCEILSSLGEIQSIIWSSFLSHYSNHLADGLSNASYPYCVRRGTLFDQLERTMEYGWCFTGNLIAPWWMSMASLASLGIITV